MGWGGILAGVQCHGRVGPRWTLGARDGGGGAGLRAGRLRRGGTAVPGGAPPGGCREPVVQSHELSRGLLCPGAVHRRGTALPAGAGAPRADSGAGRPAVNPRVGGECGRPPQAAPGAVPAAMVSSESDGSPCPAHPRACPALGPPVGATQRTPALWRWLGRGVTEAKKIPVRPKWRFLRLTLLSPTAPALAVVTRASGGRA